MNRLLAAPAVVHADKLMFMESIEFMYGVCRVKLNKLNELYGLTKKYVSFTEAKET